MLSRCCFQDSEKIVSQKCKKAFAYEVETLVKPDREGVHNFLFSATEQIQNRFIPFRVIPKPTPVINCK